MRTTTRAALIAATHGLQSELPDPKPRPQPVETPSDRMRLAGLRRLLRVSKKD